MAERADVVPLLGEVFREYGFEGATLSMLGSATGLGKGSLYHFFPGGKTEMLTAVLAEIDGWFEANVFVPLAESASAESAIEGMFRSVGAYFRSGRRVCLVGVLACGNARDGFAEAIRSYFHRWTDVLTVALCRLGVCQSQAVSLAEAIVAGIQGGIVLSRALDDPEVFERTLARLHAAVSACPTGTPPAPPP